MRFQIYIIGALFCILALVGCTATSPVKKFNYVENVNELVKTHIKVQESTKADVRDILGKPDIQSRAETSSLDFQAPKFPEMPQVPFFEEWDLDIDFDIVPKETWTYIHVKNPEDVKEGQTVKIMGINVFAKDLKTITFFFNESGKVLGYQVVAHTVN